MSSSFSIADLKDSFGSAPTANFGCPSFGMKSKDGMLLIPKEGQPKLAVGALPKESFKSAIEKELLISEPSKN